MWRAFLTNYDTSEDALTSENCVDTMDQFAAFILEQTYKSKGVEEYYAPKSLSGYFGKIKEYLKGKYPTWDIMSSKERVEKWFTPLNDRIEKKATERLIREGLEASRKAPAIGRKILHKVVTELMRIGTTEAIEMAIYIVFEFVTAGRYITYFPFFKCSKYQLS